MSQDSTQHMNEALEAKKSKGSSPLAEIAKYY